MFWKTVKRFFSGKSSNYEKRFVTRNGKMLTDDFEIAENFNKYFQNLVPSLDLKVASNIL